MAHGKPDLRDLRFVAFTLPARDARAVLEQSGLGADARIDEERRSALCTVKLAADDPRLPELLSRVEAHGERPFIRAERTWTKRELDACDHLLLRVRTAGLDGGIGLGQRYDRSGACAICGAGAAPIPPLPADLPRMGRKHLDATAHDGLLVVSAALADALVADGLTGFALEPVHSRSPHYPIEGHRWLRVISEWPPCRPDSVLHVDEACPACRRSGRYDSLTEYTELRYDAVPADACDFGRTWEYWGLWQGPQPELRVGGAQRIIVSQRVRATFARVGVRRVAFEPIV